MVVPLVDEGIHEESDALFYYSDVLVEDAFRYLLENSLFGYFLVVLLITREQDKTFQS